MMVNMFDTAGIEAREYQDRRVEIARAAASAPDGDTVHTESAPDAHDASSPSAPSDGVASPASRSKRRVNITLSTDVHDAMKRAAVRYGTNVSELCLNGWLAIKSRYGE